MTWETARDVVIVILGVESILVQLVVGVLLVVLLFRVNVLLKDKVEPFFDTAKDAAVNIKGTSSFVSETVTNPIIKVASVLAGIRKTMLVVFGGSRERR